MIPGLTGAPRACGQGLTLVHFSAQRKHFLWDTRVAFSDKTAQVEPKSGRVDSPCLRLSQARTAVSLEVLSPMCRGRKLKLIAKLESS